MKTKHTPGPWEACIHSGSFDQPFIESDHGVIGRLHRMEDRKHVDNAILIAAAPELLEALNELIPFASEWINDNHPAMIKAKQAIKKATE